jgi:hypothetical protein
MFHGLKNVKIAEKVVNRSIFDKFSCTFYEFKSRFEKSCWSKLREPIFNLMFSESMGLIMWTLVQ